MTTGSDGQVVFSIEGERSNLDATLNAATNSIARQTAKWTVLGQTAVRGIVNLGQQAARGFADLLQNSIDYNAQMQTYTANFTTLLGSQEAAEAKVAELRKYAAATPFAMTDLADATQTLLSFGLSSDDASLALTRLGEISMGDAQKLKSLTTAFAQVTSTGKLTGQDLMQMINTGFNPLQIIADKTGASMADLKAVMSGEKTSDEFAFRMLEAQREVKELGVNASEGAIMLAKIGEEGMISADMVAAAMRIATSEGGLFFGALENASETFKGQLSTLQDGLSTLGGNVFRTLFDSLSVDVMPQLNAWVDKLNKAYEEGGWEGLKTAAGGVLDEIGDLALNTGAGLLSQFYNGITGDTTTAEQIRGLLSDIFSVAGDGLSGVKDITLGALEWLSENGVTLGDAAKAAGAGLLVLGVATNPVAAGVAALAAAIALLSVDWDNFATKYPELNAWLEDTAGIDMTAFSDGMATAQGVIQGFIDFFRPAVEDIMSICNAIDFTFGLTALEGLIETFGILTSAIHNAIEAAMQLTGVGEERAAYVQHAQVNGIIDRQQRSSTKFAGKYADVADEVREEMLDYIWMALEHEADKRNPAPENFSWNISPELFQQLRTDLSEALQDEDFSIAIAEAWFEPSALADLQRILDSANLRASVVPDTLRTQVLNAFGNLTGQNNASGGILSGAARFFAPDGSLNTMGEAGPEAILPLDTLWERLGMIFDASFSANLSNLPMSIVPPIAPDNPAGDRNDDFNDFAEKLTERFARAIEGMSVDLDKRPVGRIIADEVSRRIAQDARRKELTG